MIRAILIALTIAGTAASAETLRLAATTSFNNSGLSDVLLPAIAQDTGLDVQLLVVGTGQAIWLGQSGDVDAILVHSKSAELAFVAAGYGSHRREIMYNDFVVIGPSGDPAQVRAATSAIEALQSIASAQATFVSRGDDSGTHRKEMALWAA
ncbi:substrate-binding domain-containing protein, partial [Planktomarina temperata]|nr:substrate-binding domain-containing protein [Planktomarina temperata]